MGLSGKTTKKTEQSTATTTPNTPAFAQAPIENYYSNVGKFQGGSMADYVPAANANQQAAFAGAGKLGAGSGQAYDFALRETGNAHTALANMKDATAQTAQMPQAYSAASVAGIDPRTVSTASMANLGPAAQAQAANAGKAQNVSLQGYDPTKVNLQGYDAALVGDAGQYLGKNVERVTGQSLLDGLNNYMNPYLSQVVDATAADYDDYAGQQRADMARRGAAAGAFGGSGYGIAQGQMEGDLARGRATTLSGLRSDAFNTALNASNLDAGRRQEAGIFNAGAQNERDLARGQMGFQGALANQGATNDARSFTANAYNTGSLANQSAANQAAQFGANAYNTGALSNQQANNQFSLANAGFQQDANLSNAAAQNQFSLAGFNAANDLSQFNAGAQNDASAQQYGVAAQNAQQNAAAENAARQQIYGTQADMSQFNAGQANNMSQFNSQQNLARIGQQLAAAGQAGDLASQRDANDRANLGSLLDIGNSQYSLDSASSPLAKLMIEQGLIDPGLLQAITGQTVNSNGTSTNKSSGGLLGSLASIASIAGTAASLSDRRLKANIIKHGEMDDGLGLYSWTFLWGAPGVGVMADEVERLRPWALGPRVSGYQTVIYGAL